MQTMTDPRSAARFLAAYAKEHHAGAFATPTARELEAHPGQVAEFREGHHRTILVRRELTRSSARRDFTGAPFVMPAGAIVVTHLAHTPGAPLPFLGADYVMAYADDRELALQLDRRYTRCATRISAASEIIGIWGPAARRRQYSPADQATIVGLPLGVPPALRTTIVDEVAAVGAWHDDFPYYSDGSWSAVSLRGYRPDPRWGIKPSEMPRAWQAEHPEAMRYRCDWTTLAETCPSLVGFVRGVPWWHNVERVRLLRMAGRPGKTGRLARHTDITDRTAGTRDGHIARFHVPLLTHPSVQMRAWDLDGTERSAHLPQWAATYLDARKPHAVDNPSGHDRVHLVVDVVADADVRQAITEAA